jgi:hypothetical protein
MTCTASASNGFGPRYGQEIAIGGRAMAGNPGSHQLHVSLDGEKQAKTLSWDTPVTCIVPDVNRAVADSYRSLAPCKKPRSRDVPNAELRGAGMPRPLNAAPCPRPGSRCRLGSAPGLTTRIRRRLSRHTRYTARLATLPGHQVVVLVSPAPSSVAGHHEPDAA